MDKGLTLCMVTPYPPLKSGVAAVVSNYVNAIDTYLHNEISEIHVLSHSDGAELNPFQNDDRIYVYRLFNSALSSSRNFAFIKIFREILRIRPHVVHIQYGPNGEYGGLFGEPLLILFILLKMARIPFYLTLHSAWLPEQAQERAYERTKSRFLSKGAKHYFAMFNYLFGILPKKTFLPVNEKNSRHLDDFSKAYRIPRTKLSAELTGLWTKNQSKKADTKSQRIVCLGFIAPPKGYEHVIESMGDVLRSFPDASLVIAGNANSGENKQYVDRLRSMVSEYALGNSITIEDRYLSDNEFLEYVGSAGVVVLPYSRVLGASAIMHTAMQCRTPVIVAGSGSLFEELANMVIIVPPTDHNAIAAAIIKIFSGSPIEFTSKYEDYLARHDWSVVVKDRFVEYVAASNSP